MTRKIGVLALFQLFVLSCAVGAQTAPAANDWKGVEQALGRSANCKGMELINSDFHAATSGLLSMECR
jgi:hypothetical protein